jgi:hypothetical protein
MEILTGTKQRFIQQPRSYFFPELPNIQFYPRPLLPAAPGFRELATRSPEITEITQRFAASLGRREAAALELLGAHRDVKLELVVDVAFDLRRRAPWKAKLPREATHALAHGVAPRRRRAR